MLNEFKEYMSNFIEIEEVIFVLIIAISFIIAFIIDKSCKKKAIKEFIKENNIDMNSRKIDELGRVVLPIEVRKQLQIEEGDYLTMIVDADRLILRKGQRVDAIGRITIPLHVRQTLNIKEKDSFDIDVVEDMVILRKTATKDF